MASRHCIVCGGVSNTPPSSKKITCCHTCSTVRKRLAHTGHTNVWSERARKHLSLRGQTDNLKRGTPAAQQSPIAGSFETNQEAKMWWVKDMETGTVYQVRNLRLWCRTNAASASLAGTRNATNARAASRWKTWTLTRPSEVPSERKETNANDT